MRKAKNPRRSPPARKTPTTSSPLAFGGRLPGLFGRRSSEEQDSSFQGSLGENEMTEQILIVGLGNPGPQYEGSPHSIGFEVAWALIEHWQLPKPRSRYGALITDGRTGPGGPRVVIMQPQTFMNESGNAVGPVRGSLKIDLDRIIVIHDEIDLPFGEIRTRLGGGLAGHNGLKSLKRGLGDADFWRIRVGVGRPDTTDPELVARHVLSRFRQSKDEVAVLVDDAVRATGRLVEEIANPAPMDTDDDEAQDRSGEDG